MSDYLDEALAKLAEGAKKCTGMRDRVVGQSVADTLSDFCRQDAEFAQAVVQGGEFSECIKAVLANSSTVLSDIEAYRRAVRYYFPGAQVDMQMVIRVNPHEGAPEQPETKGEGGGIVLNFSDFF